MAVFVFSDLHWFHKRIVEFEPRRLSLGANLEEMNRALVLRHNAVVGFDDESWNLGDLAFSLATRFEEVRSLVRWMHGRKFLILGNHDKKNLELYQSLGFEQVFTEPQFVHGVWLSHEPLAPERLGPHLNIHGHLHGHADRHGGLPPGHEAQYIDVSVDALPDFTPVELGGLLAKFPR